MQKLKCQSLIAFLCTPTPTYVGMYMLTTTLNLILFKFLTRSLKTNKCKCMCLTNVNMRTQIWYIQTTFTLNTCKHSSGTRFFASTRKWKWRKVKANIFYIAMQSNIVQPNKWSINISHTFFFFVFTNNSKFNYKSIKLHSSQIENKCSELICKFA